MTFDEMKQIVREQNAGYEFLRQFNLEEARKATFEDRLRRFRQILQFNEHVPDRSERPMDQGLTRRWMTIRERYAERQR